ncbi:MAG TPA: hypothetical protein DCZ40_04595 [Lachnospiraceae bacterium]|nr:hypothetical protein [Lachnospiraceae bacterium]
MEQVRYLISDAAKQVEVESHVLRYWEEELNIPIKRNELGHRYYTAEDVERFREIKRLKEQGLQLKAIRMVLKDGKLERLMSKEIPESMIVYREHSDNENGGRVISEQEKHMIEIIGKRELAERNQESKEEKSYRLQVLLQHIISEAVKESNRELCEEIKQSVLKEMDYQFRQQEEKEEERENERRKREEEHYKKVDELLRNYSKRGKRKEKDKPHRFGERKKPSIV